MNTFSENTIYSWKIQIDIIGLCIHILTICLLIYVCIAQAIRNTWQLLHIDRFLLYISLKNEWFRIYRILGQFCTFKVLRRPNRAKINSLITIFFVCLQNWFHFDRCKYMQIAVRWVPGIIWLYVYCDWKIVLIYHPKVCQAEDNMFICSSSMYLILSWLYLTL